MDLNGLLATSQFSVGLTCRIRGSGSLFIRRGPLCWVELSQESCTTLPRPPVPALPPLLMREMGLAIRAPRCSLQGFMTSGWLGTVAWVACAACPRAGLD